MNIRDALGIYQRGDLPLKSSVWGYPVQLTEACSISNVEKVLSTLFSNSCNEFVKIKSGTETNTHYFCEKTSVSCHLVKKENTPVITIYGKDGNHSRKASDVFFKVIDRLRRAKIAFTGHIFIKTPIEYKPADMA